MWEQFRQILLESIVAVEVRYFQVERHHTIPAWRERAYCYELYHQLRQRLGSDFPYTLHGEIDKRGHSEICAQFHNEKCPNPDFVVHVPGSDDNLVVIEVKAADHLERNNAKEDIDKLQVFVDSVRYQHGIFLIFGSARLSVSKLVGDLGITNKKIHVLWQQDVGQKPTTLFSDQEW